MSYANNALNRNVDTVSKLENLFNDKGIEFKYSDHRLCTFDIFPGIKVYVCRSNFDVSVYMYGIHEGTYANKDGVSNVEIDNAVAEVVRLKALYDVVN